MESAQTLLSGLSECSDIQRQADGILGNVPRTEPVEPKPALRLATHPQVSVESSETISGNEEPYEKDQSMGCDNFGPSLSNAQGQDLEQPQIVKESGKKMEAHPNDDTRKDLTIAANNSDDVSVFGLEYTELKTPEVAALQSPGDEGNENSQR
ncbi:hypothetical protein Salat_2738500 [Sesamum alatum]|uniref:Uncharacterized protein n=1 Tax=Sesamum alatum TaxID=300844 RepID=A0AAE1XK96_9LAMI|nr:hypothetical protein Salat_2738500 [Sesamum alatum]